MITHESSLEDYSSQLRYVLEHYSNHGIVQSDIQNVVLGGLGGSGIGAALAKGFFFDKLSVPLETVNDYHLPAYVNEKSLVILNSYSGNTEETLNLYDEARKAGAKMLVLSAGGTITERCQADGIKCYPIQTGFQPRMTIGFGLSYLLLILGDLGGLDLREEIGNIAGELEEKQEHQINSAETIFGFFEKSLGNKFVILADREMYPIAIRFSQQLNENAKLEAFVHPIPETNHNVLESYTDRLTTNFIMLYTESNPRVNARFDFLTGHLEMDNNRVLPLLIPQYDLFTIYDVIYRLDWASVMIANDLGAPLMEVPMISDLKEFLLNIEEVEEESEED
jgi:glucose/mannose-6-phosphate isomerase